MSCLYSDIMYFDGTSHNYHKKNEYTKMYCTHWKKKCFALACICFPRLKKKSAIKKNRANMSQHLFSVILLTGFKTLGDTAGKAVSPSINDVLWWSDLLGVVVFLNL